jgi:uncharacterized protein
MYISRQLEQHIETSLNNRKILLLLGARQVGKTTLIEHILKSHAGELLNMDIEVDRARLRAAAKLAPAEGIRSLGGGKVLVIDEAQRVGAIGRICKGWYDAHVPTKIILLGSASTTLLDTAAAELAGRNEKLWLTPLLFPEVLTEQRWYDSSYEAKQLHQAFSEQLHSLLLNRLVFGSYPEAYLTNDPRQYLTNLSSDYLLKDIFTASLVRSPEDVHRLLLELASAIGETISVAQLATRLKLSRQTVQRYLELLEGIFVIFGLPSYHTNAVREVTKSHKYYFWDTGVKNALQREWVTSVARSDIDMLWENWVVAEIFKRSRTYNRHEDLYFWRSRNGSTVDLVIKQGGRLHAFDMCFNPNEHHPSRSFAGTYGVRPQPIHRENVLELLL